MSHQDPRVRALMRAEKALKSAITHMRNAGNDVEVRDLRKDMSDTRRQLAAYIGAIR